MRLINADALIEKCGDWYVEEGPEEGFIGTVKMMVDEMIKDAPAIDPDKGKWKPFKLRPATEDEKEIHPDCEDVPDCELPEGGQRILITVKYPRHRAVYEDEYEDDGGSYLDSGYEIGEEAIAWMPMPEPYRGE